MWKYICVAEDGTVLLTTDSADDVNKAMFGEFGEPIPYAALVYNDNGDYVDVDFRDF